MDKTTSLQWHSLSIDEVVKNLNTSVDEGLSEEEVKIRQNKFGLNRLPEEEALSGPKLFLRQFKSPLIYILVIAGIASLLLREYTDSTVIFAAVGLNTIIGYFQENKASKALGELKKVLKVKAFVIRDGYEKEILQEGLVPGDLIILKSGFKVPADARLIETKDLKVNESALTGEWMPAEKTIDVLQREVPLADRDNMVYMGTVVETGFGKALVTETGIGTEIGKVAQLVKETKEEKTPYQLKLSNFSMLVGIIIAFLCTLIFIEGMLTGGEFKEMFTTSVAVAVAAIPEGLPIAMTVILALGMQRILKKQGLVRRLASAETLGSTSVICADKTGTLTEAKMHVEIILTGSKEIVNIDGKYSEKIDKDGKASHTLALKIATSCSDAFIENPEADTKDWIVRGRPTDCALVVAGAMAGIHKKDIEKESPRVDELPFDSISKYSATLNEISKSEYIVYVLGAPEIILDRSNHIELDGKQKRISRKVLNKLNKKYEGLTSKGMRVLATAYKKIEKQVTTNESRSFSDKNLTNVVFVGFIGLSDPIRPGVKEAIKKCKNAGMKPIIITGDNKLTARAVAETLGLDIKEKGIIEGGELEKLSDDDLRKRVKDVQIYARVEPAQKLRIVKALQSIGEVVAMTGDGINDAPALKQADIGVVVGSGTDVAKEVSDLVLLKDDFSVIVSAVEEGRVIIDNIRKVITYLLADSFTEVVLVGSSIFMGLPLPLTAAQILWVNLIEDGLPNIALAFEPKEGDIMNKKPERHDTPLLTKEMKTIIFIIGLITDFILLGLFIWLLKINPDINYVKTIVFGALSIDSLFFVFSCKSLRNNLWHINPFSNKLLIVSVVVGIIMLVLGIYLPIFQLLLNTVPIGVQGWMLIFGIGVINVLLIEITKWYFIVKKEAK